MVGWALHLLVCLAGGRSGCAESQHPAQPDPLWLALICKWPGRARLIGSSLSHRAGPDFCNGARTKPNGKSTLEALRDTHGRRRRRGIRSGVTEQAHV